MKSLSPNQPLVIMMLGVPGAGKSFFARQFAETFNAPLVSLDRLRFELFAEPHFNKDEELLIERLALQQIEELLKTHKTFIVDGAASTRVSRTIIDRMANKQDYGRLIIWVQTDPLTTKSRSLRRSPERPYDEFNAALTPDLYERLVKRVTPPAPHENYIVISGKHTYATQAKIVLKKLAAPRDEAPIMPPADLMARDSRGGGIGPDTNAPPTNSYRRNVIVQ